MEAKSQYYYTLIGTSLIKKPPPPHKTLFYSSSWVPDRQATTPPGLLYETVRDLEKRSNTEEIGTTEWYTISSVDYLFF
jgi:hypothetical protein